MIVVEPQALADVWEEVSPWLDAAVKENQGDESLLDVLIALARNMYMLWHEPGQFAAVVNIVRFPRQTVATIVYCGGPGALDALIKAWEEGKKWGQKNGVHVIRTFGRPGWEKVVGLKKVGVILQEEI